jgi:hypothetical protein
MVLRLGATWRDKVQHLEDSFALADDVAVSVAFAQARVAGARFR